MAQHVTMTVLFCAKLYALLNYHQKFVVVLLIISSLTLGSSFSVHLYSIWCYDIIRYYTILYYKIS